MDAATKKFKSTPFGHFKPVELSDNPAKSAGRKFASDTRTWKKLGSDKTSPDSQAAVVTKPNLPMLPRGGTKSHPNLDVKSEPAPKSYGSKEMIGAPKSGDKNLSPAVDALPTKWHKGNKYSMDVPSSLPKNSRLAKKWGM